MSALFPLLPLHGRATIEKLLVKHAVFWDEAEDAYSSVDPDGWVDELADAPNRRVAIALTQAERQLMLIIESDSRHEVIYLVSAYEPSDEDLMRYDNAIQKKR